MKEIIKWYSVNDSMPPSAERVMVIHLNEGDRIPDFATSVVVPPTFEWYDDAGFTLDVVFWALPPGGPDGNVAPNTPDDSDVPF